MVTREQSLSVGSETLISLHAFAKAFGRNVRACQRLAKRGWKDAHFIAGRWYVIVPTRAYQAALNRQTVHPKQK